LKTYIVYCEPCGFKKLIQDPNNVGLREHATSSVQGRLPRIKKETEGAIKIHDRVIVIANSDGQGDVKIGTCGTVVSVPTPDVFVLREFPNLEIKAADLKKDITIHTMPKYKCPQCGRVVTMRKSNTPLPKDPKDDKKSPGQ
jgi:DNA-directed RNA polymerase subunit RPC12/RpoP